MQFTFGIITDGQQRPRVTEVIKHIAKLRDEGLTDYQVIVVGGDDDVEMNDPDNPNCSLKKISFNETQKVSWITRKKNIITENAVYDNIVFMHDYIAITKGWYKGFVKFNKESPNWDIAMCKILNADGTRYRDWCCWDDPEFGKTWSCTEPWCKEGMAFHGQPQIVPYSYDKTQHMFVSGAFWVAKKEVMEAEPLDEALLWGQGEDVEWSLRVRDKYVYQMNVNSTVHLMKNKDRVFPKCFEF